MAKQVNISEQALAILEPLRKEFGFSYSDAIIFASKVDSSVDTNIEFINSMFRNLEILKVNTLTHEILRILYIRSYKKEEIKSLCEELISLSENSKKDL